MSQVIDVYLNYLKVKYDDLDVLNLGNHEENFKDANIFIDIDFILSFLRIEYFKDVSDVLIRGNKFNYFVSEYFNLIGHYREYFAKFGIKTHFFLLCGASSNRKQALKEDYQPYQGIEFNHPKSKKLINFIIERISSIGRLICPNHYVLRSNGLEALDLPAVLIFNKLIPSQYNVFLSQQETCLQYRFILKNTVIIRGNKSIITKDQNVFDYIQQSKKYSSIVPIQNHHIPLYQVLNDRNIFEPFVKSEKAITRKIIKFLSDNDNQLSGMDNIYTNITNNFSVIDSFSMEELKRRYEYYDLMNTFSFIKPINIAELQEQLQDCSNYEEAFKFNNEYLEGIVNLKRIW